MLEASIPSQVSSPTRLVRFARGVMGRLGSAYGAAKVSNMNTLVYSFFFFMQSTSDVLILLFL